MAKAAAKKARIGVLGASGYTGAELVRLLIRHPAVEIALLTADRRAGQEMRQVFPQFSPFELPKLQSIEGMDWAGAAARSDLLRAAPWHHAEGDPADRRDAAGEQGRRSVGRFPAFRPRRLCALVRPRPSCARAAAAARCTAWSRSIATRSSARSWLPIPAATRPAPSLRSSRCCGRTRSIPMRS